MWQANWTPEGLLDLRDTSSDREYRLDRWDVTQVLRDILTILSNPEELLEPFELEEDDTRESALTAWERTE